MRCLTSSLCIHLLIDTWLPYLGYYKQCCNEHSNIYVYIYVYMHIYIYLSDCVFIKIPRSGIAGLYGNSIFDLLKSLHTGCTSLHS